LIDIHCHILPGIDDGAKTLEDTLAMAEIAAKDGISCIVATPHVIAGLYDNSREDIMSAVDEVNAAFAWKNIPLTLVPGAEYRIEPGLARQMKEGKLLTINDTGRYLLVELPGAFIPDYTAEVLYELQLQGVTPVIAHPEKNAAFAEDPSLLADLAARGICSQVTSGSICGLFGTKIKKAALHLLHRGVVQLVASDAHSTRGRRPEMAAAFELLKKQFGAEAAHRWVIENPRRAISGEALLAGKIKAGRAPWESLITKLLPVFTKNSS